MKRFIKIEQKFFTTAIIDIDDKESDESILERIMEHCDNNGGAEAVICMGGDISFEYLPKKPTKKDEDRFECID